MLPSTARAKILQSLGNEFSKLPLSGTKEFETVRRTARKMLAECYNVSMLMEVSERRGDAEVLHLARQWEEVLEKASTALRTAKRLNGKGE